MGYSHNLHNSKIMTFCHSSNLHIRFTKSSQFKNHDILSFIKSSHSLHEIFTIDGHDKMSFMGYSQNFMGYSQFIFCLHGIFMGYSHNLHKRTSSNLHTNFIISWVNLHIKSETFIIFARIL